MNANDYDITINAPLPKDEEIAKEFISALETLASIMTRADRMGIACGYSSIQKKANGQFAAVDAFVNKRLL